GQNRDRRLVLRLHVLGHVLEKGLHDRRVLLTAHRLRLGHTVLVVGDHVNREVDLGEGAREVALLPGFLAASHELIALLFGLLLVGRFPRPRTHLREIHGRRSTRGRLGRFFLAERTTSKQRNCDQYDLRAPHDPPSLPKFLLNRWSGSIGTWLE